MTYYDELCKAMQLCAEQPNAVFMGQAVAYPGTGMTASFEGIAREKLLELPVAEEMQMGMAIGMSLGGALPICVYPRWNFLLLATNQLCNHLDKIPLYSSYKPKVIVRVGVPTPEPLDPGPQHVGDFTGAFSSMTKTIWFERLLHPAQIVPAYKRALDRDVSTVLVEYASLYHA